VEQSRPPKKLPPRALFAAIPVKAIGDHRLTASHFRVLAAIAEHDRLSKSRGKGAGCYASNKTLAEKCGVNYSNFSTVATELGRWGYIVSAPHPISRRTRVYRVIYDDADADNTLSMGKQSDDETADDSLPTDKPFPQQAAQNALPEDDQRPDIVCPLKRQTFENAQLPNDNYIPLNGKIFSERGKDSVETAHITKPSTPRTEEKGGLRKGAAGLNDGALLSNMERALNDGAPLDDKTEAWLETLVEETENENVRAQATRILDEHGASF
jgi:hypothetical protein